MTVESSDRYTLRFAKVGMEIYVMFYRMKDDTSMLEYVVPVDKLVDFLEMEDVSYVFKPKQTPEKDENPNFITGIKEIDSNLVRIRR